MWVSYNQGPDILRITRAWETVNPKDNIQSGPQATGGMTSHPTELNDIANIAW